MVANLVEGNSGFLRDAPCCHILGGSRPASPLLTLFFYLLPFCLLSRRFPLGQWGPLESQLFWAHNVSFFRGNYPFLPSYCPPVGQGFLGPDGHIRFEVCISLPPQHPWVPSGKSGFGGTLYLPSGQGGLLEDYQELEHRAPIHSEHPSIHVTNADRYIRQLMCAC